MAEEGAVITCHTAEEWTQQFNLAKESKKLVVIDFTASWCGPCRMIAPIFAELAKKYAQVIFLKVDVDEVKSAGKEWKVEAMPTFLFFKEGELVDKLVGAHREELPKKIVLHMN